MTNNVKQFLVKQKPFDILHTLLADGDWYKTKLARELSGARHNISNAVDRMEELGLVQVNKSGDSRKKLIELTDKGCELAQEVERLNQIFNEVEDQ